MKSLGLFPWMAEVQKLIYGFDPREASPIAKEKLALGYVIGLLGEAGEALQSMRYRPEWDRHQTDMDNLRGETVDALIYAYLIAAVIFPSEEAFMEAVDEKLVKNRARAEAKVEERLKMNPKAKVKTGG